MRQLYLCALLVAVATLFEGCGSSKQLPETLPTREQMGMQALQQMVKELERDGWKTDAPSRTLQLCLLDLEDMKAKGAFEVIEGDVSMCRSLNICKVTALTNAQNQLAQRLSAAIDAKATKVESSNNDSDKANPIEKENLQKLSALKSEMDVSNLLKHSYSRYRMLENGSREYKATYIYDTKQMNQSIETAMRERDLFDTKLIIEKGEAIEEYLKK